MLKLQKSYDAQITGYTSDGEGVCRIENEVVFVPGAIRDELCRLRIVNIGKTCAHAVLEQVLMPSPHRVKPDCPYFGSCGGCDFWHMDYAEELELKRQRVVDALSRIGGAEPDILPITGAEQMTGYRNKVQYPVSEENSRPSAGFFQARTHKVIPIDTCRIQPDCADRVRSAVLAWMERFHIRAYDEKTSAGYVRHIYVRKGFASGEILVCIVANCRKLPKAQELVQLLLAAEPEITTIVFSANEKQGNSVLGDEFETLYGTGTIADTLCGLQFRLSPRSFYQVNHDQAERLYQKALEFAALTPHDTVLDLYCGTGTITLCLARQAGRAIGVEIIAQAIADAKENAKRNGISNAEFFCADAGQAAAKLAQEGTHPDVIVVDPPRKGVSPDVVAAMAQMSPKHIVYVSCDPATLARDIKRLGEHGYRLKKAEAFDLFPRCAHVETIVLLSHKKADSYINVNVDFGVGEGKIPMDKIVERADKFKPKDKVTYKMIKEYILEKYGFQVHTAYIAEVKRSLGLPMYDAPNAVEELKQPRKHPTEVQVNAIKDALKHFEVI